MDYSEKWGKDVDEAVRLALADLQAERNEVNVTVLEEPTKGFFGIGSKLAKVRVEKKDAKELKKEKQLEKAALQEEKKAVRKETVKPEKKENKKEKEHKNKVESKPSGDMTEVTDTPAIPFLVDIIEKMGLSLEVKAYESEAYLYINISGKDSGTIIGKRGQTLDSIQYLTSLVVNKNTEKYIRVIVDAENYRDKREKTLEQLANRQAEKAIKSGRSIRFEPMNPYERKVIHATLQKNHKVTTKSEGEEPYRRVVIEPK